MKLLLLIFALFGSATAFAPASASRTTSLVANQFPASTTNLAAWKNADIDELHLPINLSPANVAGLSTGLMVFADSAFAGEEIEMAELPPPWVPAIFAVVLLVGVGVLTGSLGNVIDEEAQLGLQSGARARKEIERSKSSYFKKR